MSNTNIKVLADREDIVAIADAVRSKTGSTDEMTLGEIASSINGIEVGGGSVGGSGGSVETCTLIIEGAASTITTLCYQNVLGEAVLLLAEPVFPIEGTYTAVCGTLLYVVFTMGVTTTYENLNKINGNLFLITAKAGETAKFTAS